jgi:hypothetical protein
VDYSTIKNPFDGLFKSFDVQILKESKRRLCELAGLPEDVLFTKLKAKTLLPESAGPNNKVALYGVVEDALAILGDIKYASAIVQ